MVVLWMIWIDPPATPRKTSALAHAIGGTLVGITFAGVVVFWRRTLSRY
jgi:hypothetical protein